MRIFVTGTRGIPGIMGGVETHCEELFPRLAARGFDVTVVRRKHYAQDSLDEWRGVRLIDIEAPRRKALEAFVHTWRAVWRAKREGADLVHIHAIGPALMVPLAKVLGMRVVFTHHGFDYDRDKWGGVAKWALKTGERLACRYADEVIVISEGIRRVIAEKHHRTEHVHLIYNGVPEAERCDYPEYFARLGIEEGRYVLAACRFVPEKNLHDLVQAWGIVSEELKEKGEEWKLVLAGDANFEDDYSRELKRKGRDAGVVLPGFVKGRELHSLLTHAGAYCLPSSHEGLPIALLEAMSYGLPVVVSDIAANVEVGLPAESYFPVGDVSALAEKLRAVVSEPVGLVQYDMHKYNWEHIAEQVEGVYRELR